MSEPKAGTYLPGMYAAMEKVMTEPKPSAWLYTGGEDEDFASVKRWPAGVIRAQGWAEKPLFTREAIEAEIVAWCRQFGNHLIAGKIERGEYRSKSE